MLRLKQGQLPLASSSPLPLSSDVLHDLSVINASLP